MVESREKAAILAEVRYEDSGAIENEAERIIGWLERWEAAAQAEIDGHCDELMRKLDEQTRKCATAMERRDAYRERWLRVKDECDRLESQVRQLEGDLKGARKSRDHWQQVAGKHSTEIQRLKRELKAERELARMWPRFDDGAPVRVGDLLNAESGEGHAEGIEFRPDGCVIHTERVNRFIAYGTMLKRPSLKAADGQPIEVGQTLYGGDGQAWEVRNVEHGEKYPVYAVGADPENSYELKKLKPEWLTHEKPDSIRAIKVDLNSEVFDKDADELIGVSAGFLQGIVERLEKLEAKGAE